MTTKDILESKSGFQNLTIYLKDMQVDFIQSRYYYYVGVVPGTEGWIIDLSVVKTQVNQLIDHILPILIKCNASFRVVKDADIALSILNGDFGSNNIGKLISIYTSDQNDLKKMLDRLAAVNFPFIGPDVPVDIRLNNLFQVRYTNFYSDGGLIEFDDNTHTSESTFYRKPNIRSFPGLTDQWLADKLKANATPTQEQRKYRIIRIIKSDPKGSVALGIFMKYPFFIKKCIVKQARKHMFSDLQNRDMADRLQWQYHLYIRLSGKVPVPLVYDTFNIDGDAYLVMEHIKGPQLYERVLSINSDCSAWSTLPLNKKYQLFALSLELLELIKSFHNQGIIHRDITPVNFIVSKTNRLRPIDIELSYSMNDRHPNPPFEFGTHGFMSPEQEKSCPPSIKEDIFGLGATLLTIFVGLPPFIFSAPNKAGLAKLFNYFLQDESLSDMIASCLDPRAEERPALSVLEEFFRSKKKTLSRKQKRFAPGSDHKETIRAFAQKGLNGLFSQPTPMDQGIWLTRRSASAVFDIDERQDFIKGLSFSDGLAGIIYTLSLAHHENYDIDAHIEVITKNINYLARAYRQTGQHFDTSIFEGNLGIFIALKMAKSERLFSPSQSMDLQYGEDQAFDFRNMDLANGLAGMGRTILNFPSFSKFNNIPFAGIDALADTILATADKNGSWVALQQGKSSRPAAGYYFGNGGILSFLMDCLEYLSDDRQRKCEANIRYTLEGFAQQSNHVVKQIRRCGFRELSYHSGFIEEQIGLSTLFLKAYATMKDPVYKTQAERLMQSIPPYYISENLGARVGLSALGELYMDAFQILSDSLWLERAAWIAGSLVNASKNSANNTLHWTTNNLRYPCSGLVEGTSGIIHFLMRYSSKIDIGGILCPNSFVATNTANKTVVNG